MRDRTVQRVSPGLLVDIHVNRESNMPAIYSYVVAHDSGFAPNPFNNFCTLATCKPKIRKHASIGDWIVGTGSDKKGIRRGGFLVHAMRVEETLTFSEYWNDPRFTSKKPNLFGSYRMASGDNIYCPDGDGWIQMNSYHSNKDGTPRADHIQKDTSVDRVLISHDFVYFGAEGPEIPDHLKARGLVHSGRGERKIFDIAAITAFEAWLNVLGVRGYQGKPFDMLEIARKRGAQ